MKKQIHNNEDNKRREKLNSFIVVSSFAGLENYLLRVSIR